MERPIDLQLQDSPGLSRYLEMEQYVGLSSLSPTFMAPLSSIFALLTTSTPTDQFEPYPPLVDRSVNVVLQSAPTKAPFKSGTPAPIFTYDTPEHLHLPCPSLLDSPDSYTVLKPLPILTPNFVATTLGSPGMSTFTFTENSCFTPCTPSPGSSSFMPYAPPGFGNSIPPLYKPHAKYTELQNATVSSSVMEAELPLRAAPRSATRTQSRESTESDATTASGEDPKRPFVCTSCGKSYLRKCHYKQHIRVHTGEKPYGCKMCDARFKRSDECKRHELREHRDEWPFTCNICQKRSRRSDHHKNHMKQHQNELEHQL